MGIHDVLPDRPAIARFLAFIGVGVLNTAFGYAIFAAIYLLTGSYRVAIVIATAVGVVINYFTTGRLVFKNRGARAFLPFVFGYAVVCVVNILFVDALVVGSISAYHAQAIALPLAAVMSFLINDRLVFRRWS
jgi:putative flippase GtrA